MEWREDTKEARERRDWRKKKEWNMYELLCTFVTLKNLTKYTGISFGRTRTSFIALRETSFQFVKSNILFSFNKKGHSLTNKSS